MEIRINETEIILLYKLCCVREFGIYGYTLLVSPSKGGWVSARLMGLLHIIYVIEVKFKLNFSLVCQYRVIVRSATTLFSRSVRLLTFIVILSSSAWQIHPM